MSKNILHALSLITAVILFAISLHIEQEEDTHITETEHKVAQR